jgi:hypothetical protein
VQVDEEVKEEPKKGVQTEEAVFILSTLFRMSRMDLQFPEIAVEELMEVQKFLMQQSFKSRDEMHADFMKLMTQSEVCIMHTTTTFAQLLVILQKVSHSKIVVN